MNNSYILEAGQKHYQWGSHLLYGLLGLVEKGNQPLTELWFGGDSSLPSKIKISENEWIDLNEHLGSNALKFLVHLNHYLYKYTQMTFKPKRALSVKTLLGYLLVQLIEITRMSSLNLRW